MTFYSKVCYFCLSAFFYHVEKGYFNIHKSLAFIFIFLVIFVYGFKLLIIILPITEMKEMSEQGFQSDSTYPGRTNISEPEPNMLRVIVVEGNAMDSHFLLDAYYDNRMVYGMTQLNGVQHQHSLDIGVSNHISVTDSSNAIGIPFIHSFGSWGSLIQGKMSVFLILLPSTSCFHF